MGLLSGLTFDCKAKAIVTGILLVAHAIQFLALRYYTTPIKRWTGCAIAVAYLGTAVCLFWSSHEVSADLHFLFRLFILLADGAALLCQMLEAAGWALVLYRKQDTLYRRDSSSSSDTSPTDSSDGSSQLDQPLLAVDVVGDVDTDTTDDNGAQ